MPRGLLDASTDEAVIRKWFADEPQANLGVVTDKLIVLDVDPRHDGDSSLAALERDHDFPTTWRVLTGGGGEHVIFRCPEGVDDQFEHGRRATRCSAPASISGRAAATSSRRRRGICPAAPTPGTSITIRPNADRRGAGWLVEALTAGKQPGSVARRDAAQWAIDKAGLVTEYRDMAVAASPASCCARSRSIPRSSRPWCTTGTPAIARRRCPSAPSPTSSTASPIVKSPAWRTAMRDADASPSTADRLRKARGKNGSKRVSRPTDLKPDDFYAYMLEHKYIFAPTGEIWPAASVDARLPVGRQHQGQRPGSTRTAPSSR